RLDRAREKGLSILGPLLRERVEREVGRRDVDRRGRAGWRDEDQLAQPLLRLEPVAALDLDRRRSERGRDRQARLQISEERIVAGLARRADRGVDATAALEHREIVRAAAPRD